MLVLFVFCYPVRRVIATVANKQSEQKEKKKNPLEKHKRRSLTRRSGRLAAAVTPQAQ